jgi:hypothetical protein
MFLVWFLRCTSYSYVLLSYFVCFAHQIKENEVGGICCKHGRGKCYRDLVGKPEGERPLGRPRRRWEEGFRMDLREIGWGVQSESSLLRIGAGDGLL